MSMPTGSEQSTPLTDQHTPGATGTNAEVDSCTIPVGTPIVSALLGEQKTLPTPLTAVAKVDSNQKQKPARRSGRLDKYVDRIHNDLIEKLGDRTEISHALALSPNKKAQAFLQLLLDPRRANQSISRLARAANIEPIELAELMRNHHTSQSLAVFVKSAPSIAADIVQDARSIQVECPRCNGFGKVVDPFTVTEANPLGEQIDCVRCESTGLIRKPGDSDSRKLLAEAVHWTKNKSAPMVQVNNFNGGGIDSIVDEMERALEPDNPKLRLNRDQQADATENQADDQAADDGVMDAEFEEIDTTKQ